MNKNNFYFKSFSADYYVTKDKDNVSHMHVKEVLNPVFPDYNQNLGIIRNIPYTNQGGRNRTVASQSALNVTVTRGGIEEPIYSIEKEDGYYMVATGDDTTYLHGEQEFIFNYDFSHVVTDFNAYQELYWDTNGTAWLQRFDTLSARVHFADTSWLMDEEPSCYVGKYSSVGTSRCTVSRIEDGWEFQADDLKAGENLSFAIMLEPGSFATPLSYNFERLVVPALLTLILGFFIFLAIRTSIKISPKKKYYKSIFVAPQYQPEKGVTPAEAAEIAVIPTKDSRVATLIDLAVKGKIKLIKGEKKTFGKQNWSIEVVSLADISDEERIVLEILNEGGTPAEGQTFAVKTSPTKTSSTALTLRRLALSYARNIKNSLERKGYTEKGRQPLLLFGQKYFNLTEKGLRSARYLEGLKLYMKMAEKDRLAFLQSVKGADTSPTGVVKLYEKLLPYAIIFGVEESWLQEMERYYKLDEVDYLPTWYVGASILSARDFSAFSASTAASIARSTMVTASGASSSSSSGSHGGGFSGGGGGGGGGGGR